MPARSLFVTGEASLGRRSIFHSFKDACNPMTSGESAGRNGKRSGTTRKASVRSKTSKDPAPDKPDIGSAPVAISPDLQPPEDAATGHIYAPTLEEIKSELWRIATGDGTESSQVSALRALADIMGLTKPAPPDFPEGMTALLDALSEGLDTKT